MTQVKWSGWSKKHTGSNKRCVERLSLNPSSATDYLCGCTGIFQILCFHFLTWKTGIVSGFIYWYSGPFPLFLIISLSEAWVLHFRDCLSGRVCLGSARGACSCALGKWREKGIIVFDSFLLRLIFIGVWLIYNVVFVSAVQQSESVLHIHVFTPF